MDFADVLSRNSRQVRRDRNSAVQGKRVHLVTWHVHEELSRPSNKSQRSCGQKSRAVDVDTVTKGHHEGGRLLKSCAAYL